MSRTQLQTVPRRCGWAGLGDEAFLITESRSSSAERGKRFLRALHIVMMVLCATPAFPEPPFLYLLLFCRPWHCLGVSARNQIMPRVEMFKCHDVNGRVERNLKESADRYRYHTPESKSNGRNRVNHLAASASLTIPTHCGLNLSRKFLTVDSCGPQWPYRPAVIWVMKYYQRLELLILIH